MADEIHIFPFFTRKSAKAEEIGNLNSNRIILRGIAMERRIFDADAPLSFNGRQVDGKVFYWHPIAQSEDFIQKGIRYTKYGLGFAKKQGLLDRFVRKKERIN